MIALVRQLFELLSGRARVELVLISLLAVAERLVLATAAIAIGRRDLVTCVGGASVVAIWGLKGLLKQRVTRDAREKLTMRIAEGALKGQPDELYLPAGQADVAIFEGRFAGEKIVVHLLPSLVAEPVSTTLLLLIFKPTGMPLLTSGLILACGVGGFALVRRWMTTGLTGVWHKYMIAAEGTLTSVRAAPELVGSGSERNYLEKLRVAVDDWTTAAAFAERRTALFQRIPFATVAVIALLALIAAPSLHVSQAIRTGILLPPIIGLTRSVFEFVRSAPRVQTLASALSTSSVRDSIATARLPIEVPVQVQFAGVTFAYPATRVIDNVSFTWRPGQILGVSGFNGSGKSTLLKLLLGLVAPTEGLVLIGELPLSALDIGAWRRQIAYLPQRPYFSERSTVFDVMHLTIPDLTEDEARAALDLVKVRKRLTSVSNGNDPLLLPVASLSVGMRQRVMLARSFARRRAFLLFDEPDENLDDEGRAMLRAIIQERSRSQMIAIATHDRGLLQMADVVVELPEAPDATR